MDKVSSVPNHFLRVVIPDQSQFAAFSYASSPSAASFHTDYYVSQFQAFVKSPKVAVPDSPRVAAMPSPQLSPLQTRHSQRGTDDGFLLPFAMPSTFRADIWASKPVISTPSWRKQENPILPTSPLVQTKPSPSPPINPASAPSTSSDAPDYSTTKPKSSDASDNFAAQSASDSSEEKESSSSSLFAVPAVPSRENSPNQENQENFPKDQSDEVYFERHIRCLQLLQDELNALEQKKRRSRHKGASLSPGSPALSSQSTELKQPLEIPVDVTTPLKFNYDHIAAITPTRFRRPKTLIRCISDDELPGDTKSYLERQQRRHSVSTSTPSHPKTPNLPRAIAIVRPARPSASATPSPRSRTPSAVSTPTSSVSTRARSHSLQGIQNFAQSPDPSDLSSRKRTRRPSLKLRDYWPEDINPVKRPRSLSLSSPSSAVSSPRSSSPARPPLDLARLPVHEEIIRRVRQGDFPRLYPEFPNSKPPPSPSSPLHQDYIQLLQVRYLQLQEQLQLMRTLSEKGLKSPSISPAKQA